MGASTATHPTFLVRPVLASTWSLIKSHFPGFIVTITLRWLSALLVSVCYYDLRAGAGAVVDAPGDSTVSPV